MPILTVHASPNNIYLLAGALEDIVFHSLEPKACSVENTFTFTLEAISGSVRQKVCECLADYRVSTYSFDDEQV